MNAIEISLGLNRTEKMHYGFFAPAHCGVLNQNKILFGRIGRFWLPWLA